MFNSSLIRTAGKLRNLRNICNNAILRDAAKPTASASSSGQNEDSVLSSASYTPTDFDKRILVWTKKYPNIEAIPKRVSIDVIQTATSKARIRIANYMMLFTIIGCIYVVLSGKSEVKKHHAAAETEHDEWRRQITAEYKASLETDAAKKS